MVHSSILRPSIIPALVLFGPGLVGCAVDGREGTAAAADPIVNGQVARDYPEAVLVDSDRGYCSGSVIAPRVVLTAGHCVKNATRWTIKAPFASNQTATSRTAWTKYTGTGLLNPRAIDVAVIVLDTPITLDEYPPIAVEPVRDNTKSFNVGRVRNGVVSTSSLFVGDDVPLGRGQVWGYPSSYVAQEAIVQAGDSGGPTYVKTPDGRRIVAVNSGAAEGKQVLGRVDLVHEDIERIISENP